MVRPREISEDTVLSILQDLATSHEVLANRHGFPASTISDIRYGKQFTHLCPDVPRWAASDKLIRRPATEAQIIGVLTSHTLNISEASRMYDLDRQTVRKIRFGKAYTTVCPEIPRWDRIVEAQPRRQDYTDCVHHQNPTQFPYPFNEELPPQNQCSLGFPDACPHDCASYLQRRQ